MFSHTQTCTHANLYGGVPDSTVNWKIRLRAADDAWPRKKCVKTLHGESNVIDFEPELEALAA